MKSIRLFLAVSVLSVLFSSCYRRDSHWGIRGSGPDVRETRGATNFDRIKLCIDGDVFYTQDSVYRVEITGQPNILSVTETRVEGRELKISYKRNVWDHHRIRVIVHSPEIRGFDISGSGDINVENKIKSTFFDMNISGSGNIFVPSLTATSLNAKISGSGDIKISEGTLKSESFKISGSGDISTEFLITDTNTSSISGSGNITVNVNESLNVSISGSGDLHYRGKASVSADISGSGKVLHIK